MKRWTIQLKLLDPVIVSATGATVGIPECLDYLPGSLFWGAAAARLYPLYKERTDPGTNTAWLAFHSGKVRFGCAAPLLPEGPAYPVPLAWHAGKGEAVHAGGKLHAAALRNLAHTAWDPAREGQPQQCRAGWFTAHGTWHQPQQRLDLRSATDPAHFDRARESALFGYSALGAGSHHQFELEVDADVPHELSDEIAGCFCPGKTLRLGRSRSTEYGRALITGVSESEADATPPPTVSGLVILHALSDLCLTDSFGQPTLTPSPEHFLTAPPSGTRILTEHTFLRARSYSPFNHFRNVFALERQVLLQGSVITLEIPSGISAPLRPAAGLWTEQGLGRFLVNPAWLVGATPVFSMPQKPPAACRPGTATATATATTPPHDTMWCTLSHRHESRVIASLALTLGQQWAPLWLQTPGARHIRSAQWGKLRETADGATSKEDLLTLLRGPGKKDDPKQKTSPTEGLFNHGALKKVWNKTDAHRTPASVILDSLESDLGAQLTETGMDRERLSAFIDRLLPAACREAAIAAARQLARSAP